MEKKNWVILIQEGITGTTNLNFGGVQGHDLQGNVWVYFKHL